MGKRGAWPQRISPPFDAKAGGRGSQEMTPTQAPIKSAFFQKIWISRPHTAARPYSNKSLIFVSKKNLRFFENIL
jgi:hypothetical protein